MSNILKLAIPLIDPDISLKDIDSDTGFNGAYFEDLDRPYLDSHIFLLYDWNKDIPNAAMTFYKFKNLKSFHGYKTMYVDGKPKIVYTFTCTKAMNTLRDGCARLYTVKGKEQVLKFWNFTDEWVTNTLLSTPMIYEPATETLPLEDYLPD